MNDPSLVEGSSNSDVVIRRDEHVRVRLADVSAAAGADAFDDVFRCRIEIADEAARSEDTRRSAAARPPISTRFGCEWLPG